MTIFNSGHQQLGDFKGKRFVTALYFLFWSICVAGDTGSEREKNGAIQFFSFRKTRFSSVEGLGLYN